MEQSFSTLHFLLLVVNVDGADELIQIHASIY